MYLRLFPLCAIFLCSAFGCTQSSSTVNEVFVSQRNLIQEEFSGHSISRYGKGYFFTVEFEPDKKIIRLIRDYKPHDDSLPDIGEKINWKEYTLIQEFMKPRTDRLDSSHLYLQQYIQNKIQRMLEYGLSSVRCTYNTRGYNRFYSVDGRVYVNQQNSNISKDTSITESQILDDHWYFVELK